MGRIEHRLDQLEKQLGRADCVCSERAQQCAIIVIKESWGQEQIERAEASIRFICPIHGDRSPPIVRLSETDAKL
jgi:hypothetical protein